MVTLRLDETLWSNVANALLQRLDVESAAIIIGEPFDDIGGQKIVVAREAVIVPEEAYLIRRNDQLRIDPVALNRLLRPVRDRGGSVYTVHTHPGASAPWFSPADDAGDGKLMPALYVQSPLGPHGSMVLTPDGQVAARTFTAEGQTISTRVTSVGGRITFLTDLASDGNGEWFDRQRLVLGSWGQTRLAGLRVGVVGAGGIGSLVMAQLAHLGVRALVLIDDDLVEASNVPRIMGARGADVGEAKTAVVARYARSLGLGVEVHEVAAPLDARSRAALHGCDLVFACVDCHTPRAMLNRMAYELSVPVIDLGTVFRVGKGGALVGDAGRVVVVGPGRPCLACWGHLDPKALREEALPPDERDGEIAAGYIQGAHEQQPSVMPFNAMVAAAGVIEMLRLAAGFGGLDDEPVHRLAFSFTEATVKRNRVTRGDGCRICSVPAGSGVAEREAAGFGGRAQGNVG
jgi:hypothetical protein